MLPRSQKYFRKTIFLSILIYLLSFILLQYIRQTNICRTSQIDDEVVLKTNILINPIENHSSIFHYNPLVSVQLADKGRSIFYSDCDDGRCYRRENVEIWGKVKKIQGLLETTEATSPSQLEPEEDVRVAPAVPIENEREKSGKKVDFINKAQRVINTSSCKITLIEERIIIDNEKQSSGSSHFGDIFRFIYRVRDQLVQHFYQYLPSRHAGLAVGVLLGVKSRLDQDFYEQLVITGTLHVVAASGYNISIIVTTVVLLLKRIVRKPIAIAISLISIVIYVVLAGSSSAVIRAGLMGAISSLGILTGRVYSAKWALFFSIVAMLLYSPLFLLDISFQLSVAATAGILWLEPISASLLFKSPKKKTAINSILKEFGGTFATTISASVMTIPIILLHFGRLSVISFVANTLLLWVIPYLMAFSALFLIIGSVHPVSSLFLSFFVWIGAEVFIQGVALLSRVPFAQLEVKNGTLMFALFVYILISFVYFRYRNTPKKL